MKDAIALFGPNGPNGSDNLSFSSVEGLHGYVYFYQQSRGDPVLVEIQLHNVPKGYHGIHIHSKPLTRKLLKKKNCCKALGGHWNAGKELWSPTNLNGTKHGLHAGDLCLNLHSNGVIAQKKFFDPKISLYGDKKNIVGKSVVLHEDMDDGGVLRYEDDVRRVESWQTGNAGTRIACSNISSVSTHRGTHPPRCTS